VVFKNLAINNKLAMKYKWLWSWGMSHR